MKGSVVMPRPLARVSVGDRGERGDGGHGISEGEGSSAIRSFALSTVTASEDCKEHSTSCKDGMHNVRLRRWGGLKGAGLG